MGYGTTPIATAIEAEEVDELLAAVGAPRETVPGAAGKPPANPPGGEQEGTGLH